MPIGNVSKDNAPKRDNYRPPWVKDKNTDAPPPWTQKKLKPVESTKTEDEPIAKPAKPGLKKQATIREKGENGVTEAVEEKLVKPSSAKQLEKVSKPAEEPKPRFTKTSLKPADKSSKTIEEKKEEKSNDKVPEKSSLKTVRTIDDRGSTDKLAERPVPKTTKFADEKPSNDKVTKPTLKTVRTIDEKGLTDKLAEKPVPKTTKFADEKPSNDKVTKPTLKTVRTIDEKGSTDKLSEKPISKTTKFADEKPSNNKLPEKSALKSVKTIDSSEKSAEKPSLRSVRTIDDKAKEKSVTIIDRKPTEKEEKSEKPLKNGTIKNSAVKNNITNEKTLTNSSPKETKPVTKVNETPKESPKVEETVENKSKMATKPPTPLEKTPSKLPPRKPSIQKQPSKDEPVKKWRDPLHERVKKNIDDTLNEIPKGHTLTKNESLRSLLKPTPPPMPPPMPPKMPPPPEFKKAPIDPSKLKKLESLRSRPRKRPDWSDMMKEVEDGKKLKHVVCNDRSSPIITKTSVVKNKEKDQFIYESEKPNSHNQLLNEINKGVKLKKTKTNDRSKPNLEGLRKFRRQMTIEEQVQKSMSQANLQASPSVSGLPVAEVPAAEEEEIDEMDDIDKVRDDLQSTKQLLAIELRNKEAQERENKRLQTKIQNLEAELARERAIMKQEQHKTVISVTDAYDERLVNSLKMEVERTKENADSLEKKYLDAAEDRDTALTELEELKRRNAELEKKLEQALSNKIEEMYLSEEPLSFYQKRQLDFEKQCRLLDIDINSPEAEALKRTSNDANNNSAYSNYAYTNAENEGIMPTNMGSRRSSHAIKQLSVTKDDSFEEEDLSEEEEEEESEEKKQKRMEKEVRNMRNKIRHLKEKQDNMKRERMGYKMALKNQQAALKDEKRKYKDLKRDVDKMASMMKEVGSDDDEEEEEESEESKSETEEEETETETEQDTESETESESEPEDAPLPKKKENLSSRLKRHETRVHALKKGNALLMANVDRLKDDVLKQREESVTLQKELDSLIDDLE